MIQLQPGADITVGTLGAGGVVDGGDIYIEGGVLGPQWAGAAMGDLTVLGHIQLNGTQHLTILNVTSKLDANRLTLLGPRATTTLRGGSQHTLDTVDNYGGLFALETQVYVDDFNLHSGAIHLGGGTLFVGDLDVSSAGTVRFYGDAYLEADTAILEGIIDLDTNTSRNLGDSVHLMTVLNTFDIAFDSVVDVAFNEWVGWSLSYQEAVSMELRAEVRYLGDINGDGTVDDSDAIAFNEFYILGIATAGDFDQGDFNGDAVVDLDDWDILWNTHQFLANGGSSSVPEPTTACVLGLLGLGMMSRRRHAC